MKLTDKQWDVIEPLLPKPRAGEGQRGRPPRSFREVFDGILWVMRTGAPWQDMPARYPSYQTCHRRFQEWAENGTLEKMLVALRRDRRDRGGIEDVEAFIDGTYVPAKKGDPKSGNAVQARQPRSWQSQTAMVFHSLLLLLKETDTTLLSQSERSTLHSSMNSRLD